jgi:BolA protein
MNLIDIIQERLKKNFSPTLCEVIDDSERHKGHAAHREGGRHFIVRIQAECFLNLSRVNAHREIYKILEDLMPDQVHALNIVIL